MFKVNNKDTRTPGEVNNKNTSAGVLLLTLNM